MEPKRVIVEVLPSAAGLSAVAFMPTEGSRKAAFDRARSVISNIDIDQDFVAHAAAPEKHAAFSEELRPFDLTETIRDEVLDEGETLILRGTVERQALDRYKDDNKLFGPQVRVYVDPLIESCTMTCVGTPPVGTWQNVQRRLDVPALRRARMTGAGVNLAIVDTGINLEYLRNLGLHPRLDAAKSWVPRPAELTPGALPVNHGTMCAFDALLAAPECTLLDVAVLLSNRAGGSAMDGLLSDAFLAYAHLHRIMTGPHRPGEGRSMVVSNSWGMFRASWDFPIDHPSNYSHNPNHPFNRMVGRLSQAGADILFAAGNCGRECMDSRCGGVAGPIYGANSHPRVITVAGVDIEKHRVGYSTRGPGTLSRMKPDLCGYTHFRGSGVYAADGGTSAATPVVAGVMAAFRSRFPYTPTDPLRSSASVRSIFLRTAEDRGSMGFDFEYGWGIVNGSRLAAIRALTVTAREPMLEAERGPIAEPTRELVEQPLAAAAAAAATREAHATTAPSELTQGRIELLEARLKKVEQVLNEAAEELPRGTLAQLSAIQSNGPEAKS